MKVPLAVNFGIARPGIETGGLLVNLYAQDAAKGAKGPVVLIGAPGTRPFAQLRYLNDVLAATDDTNVNAMLFAFDRIVVVTDHAVYFVEENGTVSRRANTGIVGPVSMAFNRLDVAAVGPGGARWINEAGVSDITDTDFYPADAVCFLDSYFVFNRRETGQVFQTGSYTRDISGLDFADAEKAPDDAVGVIAAGEYLFIFGEATTEVWYNASGAQFAFARAPGTVMEHGCAAVATATQFNGDVTWLTPGGLVVRATGLAPIRISDEAVEAALAERKADWSSARAFTYSDEGHTFYVLTVGDLTLAFDDATSLWHQRRNYSRGHVLARCYVRAWGRHFVGDDKGRILELASDAYDDAGEPLVAEAVSVPITADGALLPIGGVEVELDAGIAPLDVEASVLLGHSRNGGRTWAPDRTASAGRTGEWLHRTRWRKFSAAREHRFRVRISAPFRRRILSDLEVMA